MTQQDQDRLIDLRLRHSALKDNEQRELAILEGEYAKEGFTGDLSNKQRDQALKYNADIRNGLTSGPSGASGASLPANPAKVDAKEAVNPTNR